MPQSALSPDKAFAPAHSPQRNPLAQQHFDFDFGIDKPTSEEQLLYKHLIHTEIEHKRSSYAVLAQSLGISKSVLHKCIRGPNLLTDDRRDAIFEILGIDHVRAKVCVVLLRNTDLYDDFTATMLSEAVKALYCQIDACKNGIQLEIKPPMIHELMKRGMDMLLEAQEEALRRSELRLFPA